MNVFEKTHERIESENAALFKAEADAAEQRRKKENDTISGKAAAESSGADLRIVADNEVPETVDAEAADPDGDAPKKKRKSRSSVDIAITKKQKSRELSDDDWVALSMRLTRRERRILNEYAQRHDTSAVEVVRTLIHELEETLT